MPASDAPVLLCTDGSDLSVAALRAGLDLLGRDRPLVVAIVVDPPDVMAVTGTGFAGGTMSPEDFDRAHRAAHDAAVAVIEQTATALDLGEHEARVLEGEPGSALCQAASELGASAVVLGSRGRSGLARAVLGSVSDHVVRNAPCPVVVVNGD